MRLTKLAYSEEYSLRAKVGDLNKFKEKILNSRISIDDFEIYKDAENPSKKIYIALKHNPLLHVKDTGLKLG